MATKFLERYDDGDTVVDNLSAETAGNVAPIAVDDDTERIVYYDRTNDRVLTVKTGVDLIYTPTAAETLTVALSGRNIMLNASAGFAITLPAPAAGLRYRFTVAAAFATSNFTVGTNGGSNIIEGSIVVAGAVVDADARDTINFVATAENIGDFVEVWSDGTSWFVFGNALTAGGITFSVT